MLSISNEYELSLNDNSSQLIKAKIAFADKTVRELTGDDIVSCSFDQQVSSDSSFDIGTAIIGQMNITLNNHDGRFDACDFTDSKFKVWVGKELSTGTEWIQRGLYTANQPDAYNGTIEISALDTLSRFEVPFSEFVEATGLRLNSGVQIRQVIDLMCRYRGVKWDDDGNKAMDETFNFGYVDNNATCRQVLAYCCQVCCVNASATYNGHLRTVWYDTSVFESEDGCDGGVFDSDSPYSTGVSKDGGDFLDYSSGDSVDGGDFFANRMVHTLYAFSSITVNTDDVVITGVSVSERSVTENGETVTGETVKIGNDGYVLAIGNNPLILPGDGRKVAERIAEKVIGMRFRPFSGKHICVPSIEAGDCAYVVDRKQNVYKAYVTRVKYTVNGGMDVACGAKSASRNSADNAGASTSAYVKARNEIQRELSARDLAIKNLGESLANAKGMYHTEVKQDDGSYVYYLHDKPTTGDSRIIYKITAEGIGISTDSGKTYATGLTADGDAILNRIYAIGIDANYIKTGRISAQKGGNFIDLDTGEANLELGASSTVGGKDIATTDSAAAKTLMKYATSISNTIPPTIGWMDACPERSPSYFIWFKIITVMQDGSQVESVPACISGADGSRGPAGADGNDGRGIKSSVPEYYLSWAPNTPTGGSWSTGVPSWVSGTYYWQRLHITWSDGSESYTQPVYDVALTEASSNAQQAIDTVNSLDQKKVFNMLTDNGKVKGLFTKDGQLFINADYIGSGSIDAKQIAIRNLLSIGDDDNSVSVSSSGISFMTGGIQDALTIKPKSYKMVTYSECDDGGSPIWEAVGNASNPPGYTFKCTERAQAYVDSSKIVVAIGVRVDFYANGKRIVLGETYNPVKYQVDTNKSELHFSLVSQGYPFMVYYGLKKTGEYGSNGLPCYDISVGVGVFANGAHVCFNGIDIYYSSPGYGGEIAQKSSGSFLNRDNFIKEVTDRFPLTCQVRIPIAFNNVIRDYVLTFEKGLLVGWDYYTPTDPQYRGY